MKKYSKEDHRKIILDIIRQNNGIYYTKIIMKTPLNNCQFKLIITELKRKKYITEFATKQPLRRRFEITPRGLTTLQKWMQTRNTNMETGSLKA